MSNLQLSVSEFGGHSAGKPGQIHSRSRQSARRCYCRSTGQANGVHDRQSNLKAVVIGAGFAGLSTAAGLSRQFSRVTLLDRDCISDPEQQPENGSSADWHQYYEGEVRRRKGVSQYKQPHIMLQKGLHLIEQQFPGYMQALSNAGALPVDHLTDMIFADWGQEKGPGGQYNNTDFRALAGSRHLYETVLRKFVLDVANVQVETDAAVNGLLFDASRERVTGVHLKNGRTVEADLVVDASGKQSNVSKWLEQLGHAPPDTISVASGLRYTYRMYEMTDDPQRDWTIAVCMDHPEYNRTAVVIPIETNKWLVNLSGYPGHHCPTDEEGFLEWAGNLPSPTIHDTLVKAKPVSPISSYSKTDNFRRLFEKTPPPSGLCVIGDAACYFNPINGQGMTVGLMGSHLLSECIQESLASAGDSKEQQQAALDTLPTVFHTKLGALVEYPWAVSTGPDAAKPDAVVKMPKQGKSLVRDLMSQYFVALAQARFHDDHLWMKLTAVGHMLASPATLFGPDVVARLLWFTLTKRLKVAPTRDAAQGTTAAGHADAAAMASKQASH
ncbi:hypothetical protein ABBQ38_001735 [Trebouxia sp. C0009 RCD-2024]